MSKTTFSKGQIIQIHKILASEKFIPCDKIEICTDTFNSGIGSVCNVIKFAKGKKQLSVSFITKTYPKTVKLQEQLYEYFGGKE